MQRPNKFETNEAKRFKIVYMEDIQQSDSDVREKLVLDFKNVEKCNTPDKA